MAGALTISTLNNDTGVLATQNGMTGIAKAWVNFDGVTSPPTIRGQFNVGSVTKNGTGDYTVNFTTAMPNANFSVAALSQRNNTAGNVSFTEILASTSYDRLTTGGVRVACRDQAVNLNDALCFTVTVHSS